LAQTVRLDTGAKNEIGCESLPVDDPQGCQPDITRAQQLLGWEPKVSLEEGLRRMLEANERESLSV
jgi:nucleoside-diphosphate-sugar epimerase